MPTVQKLPIVYVRGFAGDTEGIDEAVADPFYGFNEGSTHVRVGPGGEPYFHQFESPLLRLHLDHGYQILVGGGQDLYLESQGTVPQDAIWIHRFYDVSSGTWGRRPTTFRMETAAEGLLEMIERIRRKSGAPRVHLIAHSMGGLVCRCLIQKILPDLGRDPAECIGKLFTYGTPHGGIAFDRGLGLLEALRDATNISGADIFGRERMYEYLTPESLADPDGPPEDWDPRQMPADRPLAFPLNRVFCLVGTDPADYAVARGLSAAVVGPRSDGLVQMDNAYVPGAHRAYVHRSHSGSYGLVNSEEGYQNLRRFLFGDRRVEAALVGHRLPRRTDTAWQAEVALSVRGLQVVMYERSGDHWCPIQLHDATKDGGAGDGSGAVPLADTFLCTGLPRPGDVTSMRFTLHLRILSLREREGFLAFGDHLEQTADFDDVLVVDLGSDPEATAPPLTAAWNSAISGAIREYRPEPSITGLREHHIELPKTATPLLGENARLRLTVTPWE
ncbi:esterase/lipase family protein [Streptomyces sp. NPDC002911]